MRQYSVSSPMAQLMGFSSDQAVVVDLLMRSISSEEHQRAEAYARILELETSPTFLATLVDVAYLGDANVSKLAFICAKNALTRVRGAAVTRGAGGHAGDIADIALNNLKAKLYTVLQAHLNSAGRIMSKDFALLVRKVCRWNYPQSWMSMHELLTAMLEAGASDATASEVTLNAVMLTYHIFKEKCSMRLMKDRNVTVQVAQVLYPLVSKLWLQQWLGRWEEGKLDGAKLKSTFSSIDIALSRYLDSLLIALYTHGPRDVYQNKEMLELLKLVFAKLRLHLSFVQKSETYTELLCKNSKRLLRCASRLFEYEPLVFAFVNPSLVLNPLFDFLSSSNSAEVTSECMTLLCNVFKSPVVNNDRYTQQYSALNGDNGMSSGPSKGSTEDFVLCSSFEEMKAQCEMTASCAKGISIQSLKKSSSPTKGPYYAIGSMAEYLSRQATFLFCESIGARGGLLKLIDFLRDRYLTLTLEAIEEWGEETLPMDPPHQSQCCAIIEAMKVTGSQILQSIVGGILGTDCKANFLGLDSYLALYTISYTGLASNHSSKHYLMILDALKHALNAVDPPFAKLLIFRCSRIVNAWIKRINFFEEQVKVEILRYLVYCICCDGDSMNTLNLRVQHLVPFHRIYSKTIDQPFWDVLRQGNDIMRIVSSVVMISKIEVPVIQHRALELVCKMCLEFDNEDNNFGNQLSDVLIGFSAGCNDLQVTASLLQTSLSFLNSLDWERCYAEDSYVNSHLRRFLFHLLFRMVVINGVAADAAMANISGNQGGQRLVSINRHQELEEDTYMLWLCLLRVLPRNMEVVEHELRESIFSLFPLLLTYLTESDNSEHPGQMRVKSSPVLALDVVTEYVTVLLDYVKAYHPEGVSLSSKGGTAFANLYEKNGEILFVLIDGAINTVEFSISRVQALCLQCLKCTDEDPLRQGGLQLLSMLMFAFGSACLANKDVLFALHHLVLFFCGKLNEAGMPPGEALQALQRSRLTCMSDGSRSDSKLQWQHSKVPVGIIESVASLVPILCRWGFNSPALFSEALISALESGKFVGCETLLLSLINASNQFSNNAYLRLGAIICCCLMTNVFVHKYGRIKLFVQFQDRSMKGTNHGHSEDDRDNPHPNLLGVYLPCYMLRLVESIISLFVESKRASCFSITKASLVKDSDAYALPASRRFHLFANASSTYQSTAFPMSELPAYELFYGALKSTIQCITQLSRALESCGMPGSMGLLFEEASHLNPKIREIINTCHSGNA